MHNTDTLLATINRLPETSSERTQKTITPKGKIALQNYHWPGNIRELHSTLDRAWLKASGNSISENDINDSVFHIPIKNDGVLDKALDDFFNLQSVIEEVGTFYIKKAMKECGNRKSEAAKVLSLGNHQNLTNRIKKYGINFS